jgi:hypothetical protein
MNSSYTTTASHTLTNAKTFAAEVASEMRKCRRSYGKPSEEDIVKFEEELIILLVGNYISTYEFGFKMTDDTRIVSWLYEVTSAGDIEDGPSNSSYTNVNVSKGKWFNFLSTNSNWSKLSQNERDAVNAKHEIERAIGEPPADGAGQWVRNQICNSTGMGICSWRLRGCRCSGAMCAIRRNSQELWVAPTR